jgi:hypothetical protein
MGEMKTKLLVLMVAAAGVAAFSQAAEKGKLVPSARPGNTGTTAVPVLLPDGPIADPSNFHAGGPMTPSSTTIDLNWMDNSNNESGFKISRKIASWASYPPTPLAQLGPNTTKYHDTGLEPETTYSSILAAHRNGTVWSHAVEVTATTNPRPPTNLQAQALSPKKVQLSWQNHSNTANLIMIERREGNGGFGKIFQTQAMNTATYLDEGLKSGTAYSYRLVVLKLPFNASDYTPVVSAVTMGQK